MAENKYDLLLVETTSGRPPRHQPWFKERLRTKSIKEKTASGLDSSQWVFLKDGIDDFRDGAPLEGSEGLTKRKGKIELPIISSSSTSSSSVAKTRTQPSERYRRSRISKESAVASNVIPMQQKRRDYIDLVEKGLLASPFTLYPYLEESLEPDVLNDVANILCPNGECESSVAQLSTSGSGSDGADNMNGVGSGLLAESLTEEQTQKVDGRGSRSSVWLKAEGSRRPEYQWRPPSVEKTDAGISGAAKTSKSNLKGSATVVSPLEETVVTVTREFCDRMRSLGDESATISEQTVKALFASGYETKPPVSVPVHVVELMNVPTRLKQQGNQHSWLENESELERTRSVLDCDPNSKPSYVPSWANSRKSYGAWYLPKSLWKYRSKGETLEDPKKLREKAVSQSKKKMGDMDDAIAPLHGARAFKDFVCRKNKRMPKAVANVPDHKEEQRHSSEAVRRTWTDSS